MRTIITGLILMVLSYVAGFVIAKFAFESIYGYQEPVEVDMIVQEICTNTEIICIEDIDGARD